MKSSVAEHVEKSQEDCPLAWAPCLIERQFPIAKVSMESYKERCSKQSQTLTPLGKWWGRKPLVMIRAALLGLLLPTTDDPAKDREIFLKLMTMDDEGLLRRKDKAIPQKWIIEELQKMPPSMSRKFWDSDSHSVFSGLTRENKTDLQRLVFERMSYSEKLKYCRRPEQVEGPSADAWRKINAHLDSNSQSLRELVEELGKRRFGHRPRVGDSFCGAGSVPFETARLGCDVYGSDLSPVAALLTWAALNIVGGGEKVVQKVKDAQQEIFEAVDRQVTEWGIENNEESWRADAFLYCVEALDPESGWMVPLAPSWVVGEKPQTVAKLVPDAPKRRYDIEILEGVSDEEMTTARETGTVKKSRLVPPNGGNSTPIDIIRRNLRMWENEDVVPRPEDVFQERLYCIRWVESYYELKKGRKKIELTKDEAELLSNFNQLIDQGDLKQKTRKHYRAPTAQDLEREKKVLALLEERFTEWQEKGFIPSRTIEPGAKTDEPIRTRGWTHWHHLFSPRQLLVNGLLSREICGKKFDIGTKVSSYLGLSRCLDYNAKLSRWHTRKIGDKSEQVFSNQALNTIYNYAVRSTSALNSSFFLNLNTEKLDTKSKTIASDCRVIRSENDIWITDPPYADAINYHELSEFFLSWYEKQLPLFFHDWSIDSKRALAVKGNDESFRKSMVDCYQTLKKNMPDNGLQIVMFTHQDAAVWADLSLILWAAGLRVTAAWCIATETDSALKQGNYVQGTVLLILRKRTEEDTVFLDELNHKIEIEVKRQLDSMIVLEDKSDPNFGDADYQLAAYAAALRILTERPIEEIDPTKELLRQRNNAEENPVEQLIRNAVKIACDYLVPRGIAPDHWKTLSPMERFYLKGIEVESHGEYRSGVYQELARGFAASGYTDLLAETKANQTRLKTASEFGRKYLSGDGFAGSLVRQVLFAVHQVVNTEQTRNGLNWLKAELPDYWQVREKAIHLLDFLASLGSVSGMKHWKKDAEAAALVAGAVRNDHV